MEEEVVRMLNAEKPKLEQKYCVQITTEAFDLAVAQSLLTFDSNLNPDDTNPKKAIQILEGACELVLENFRNCAYEKELHEKAYQRGRALVEITELCRDNDPDSRSWLTRVKRERESASTYINDFLDEWETVLKSAGWCDLLFPKTVRNLKSFKHYGSKISCLDCSLVKKGSYLNKVTRRIDMILDDVHGQLIKFFRHLLTVRCYHVAEVVSGLTDIPLTQILPCTHRLKKEALRKAKQRLVHQDTIINGIFDVVCRKNMTTRPRGLFMILGFSGVGKTEVAKAIAEHWYCDVSRLVEIDMSEYAEPQLEPASCELSEWLKRKHQNLLNHLTEVVGKRPYSVILLDKIEKASSSVTRIIHEVLSKGAPSIDGSPVDFSKSIIFLTSSVGAKQLSLACTCFNRNEDLWEQFKRNCWEFYKNHNCTLKGSGSERALTEARKFFSADLLDSLDKIFVMDKFHNQKAVARLLVREIIREVGQGRLVVHVPNAALDVLLKKARRESAYGVGIGMAIKKSLLEHVIPYLSAAEGCSNTVVCIDTLVGTSDLSFRIQSPEQYVNKWYFKKDGTISKSTVNLRMKVESFYMILDLRRKCLPLLGHLGPNFTQLGGYLLAICESILTVSPVPNTPKCVLVEGASHEVAPGNLPTSAEKEAIKNRWIRLQENVTGLAKATSIVVDSVLKIIDPSLQLPDSLARHYLLLCLDNDAKMGLINYLMESLRTGCGNPLFAHLKLENNCNGEMLKKFLIEEVKNWPCKVFLLDGIEIADDVFYSCLLEIFDKGYLDDGEGFSVDFQKTIFILTSASANKRVIAKCFNYSDAYILQCVATNQNVKRFRTELLLRVDEIICFDPLLPEHASILRFPKRDRQYMEYPYDFSLFRFFLYEVFKP